MFCKYNLQFYTVVPFVSAVEICEYNSEILVILRHYFKLDLEATEAACRIQEVKNEMKQYQIIIHKNSLSISLPFEIKSRKRQESLVNYDTLKYKVEENVTTINEIHSEKIG